MGCKLFLVISLKSGFQTNKDGAVHKREDRNEDLIFSTPNTPSGIIVFQPVFFILGLKGLIERYMNNLCIDIH